MTIQKGQPWGAPTTAPQVLTVVHSDAQLASCDSQAVVCLAGGDLHRALGSPIVVSPGQECTQVDIDAMDCTVTHEGSEFFIRASSSVVVGSWWTGSDFVCVTNGGQINGLDLAPRAHPNDGRFDVVTLSATMSLRQRLMARKRAATGTHIPHPAITLTRPTQMRITQASRPRRLCIDGQLVANWTSIEMVIRPDYWHVLI